MDNKDSLQKAITLHESMKNCMEQVAIMKRRYEEIQGLSFDAYFYSIFNQFFF